MEQLPDALGRVDISTKPNYGADKLGKAQIVRRQPVKTREAREKMLQFVNKILNQVMLTVQPQSRGTNFSKDSVYLEEKSVSRQ